MAKKAAAKKPVKKIAKPKIKKPATKKAMAKKASNADVKISPSKIDPPRKGYNRAELERFKVIINEKRKDILEDLDLLRTRMMDVTTGEFQTENSAYSLHMEQGTDTMEREKTFLFASREVKFLNYLDDALRRIEKGDYGFCTDCGKLIEKERLEAVPHAKQCIECKLARTR